MGFDLCSPERNKTSDNRPCHSPCREEEGGERHYKCHTSHDMTVKDHCGNWDVTEFTTKALEYDDKDRVGIPYTPASRSFVFTKQVVLSKNNIMTAVKLTDCELEGLCWTLRGPRGREDL